MTCYVVYLRSLQESQLLAALDISTGPLARRTFQTAGPVRASTFYLSLARTGHIFFARAPVPHLGSTFATARSQRDASRSRACQSNTLTSAILQCEHPGRIRALFSAKHMAWFRVNSVSFVWWFIEMRGDFWSVNLKYWLLNLRDRCKGLYKWFYRWFER